MPRVFAKTFQILSGFCLYLTHYITQTLPHVAYLASSLSKLRSGRLKLAQLPPIAYRSVIYTKISPSFVRLRAGP